MIKERAPGKLSFGLKIGYGAGTAADSITYTLFYTCFLYFLTDVVGMNPGIGGTISFIAILWDAVTDPVVGFWSDNTINPAGRRRPFILRSVWPLAVSVFLLFATSGPMYIIAFLAPMGLTEGQYWMVTAALSGIILVICGSITARVTKGRDVPAAREKGEKFKFSFKAMISQYADYFTMRDYLRLTIFQLISIVGYTIMSNGNVYMLSNLAGLDEARQGVFWSVFSIVFLAECALFFIIGIHGFVGALIFGIGIADATFT